MIRHLVAFAVVGTLVAYPAHADNEDAIEAFILSYSEPEESERPTASYLSRRYVVVYVQTLDESVLQYVTNAVRSVRANGYNMLVSNSKRADGDFIEIVSEGKTVARFESPTIYDISNFVIASATLQHVVRFGPPDGS